MNKPNILVKTPLGLENIAAARILELNSNVKVYPRPQGFLGLVLVEADKHFEFARKIKENVLEAEKVIPAYEVVEADLNKIVEAARKVALGNISSEETFAVRTTRRGKHDFTSLDVNVKAGAAVKEVTNASVNLSFPDKIVDVEIIGDIALISILKGTEEYKKLRPGKEPVVKYLRKIALIQMPYLGPLDASYNMGVRIGREAQTFEVKELVIAPIGSIPADQLLMFLKGVYEGIESRYSIQKKTYARKVNKIPVYVQDLYQVVRDRFKEPIIVFEPEGEPVIKMKDKIKEIFNNPKVKRINILIGSRVGIPVGIYRFADLILDIAPGVTISTDLAAASAITALITVLESVEN